MKPGTVWIGVMLMAVGVGGLLDAAGVVDSSRTVGQWWPLAVIGWPLTEMFTARRITLGGVICAAVGLTLLADQQQWVSGLVVWSCLAVFIGIAVLTAAVRRRQEQHFGNGVGMPVTGASS
jgi:sugar phosphate permease